jgi:outer membrane receptor protein involved in Fe transport
MMAAMLSGTLLYQPAFAAETDEIVVTVRKREEALQETPVSVSAFTADTIEERQIREIGDVARFAPGLNFARAFGRTTERPVIRGQGNVLAGVQFGVESGVAYFVDGVYYPGDLQSLNPKEIERIEVIRGPQAALFGRNTYSGAINFITKDPTDEVVVDAGMRLGQDADNQLTAGISGQLIDGVLGASLNGRYYTFDGEYFNRTSGQTVGDEESKSVSATLKFTPIEDLTLRSRLNFQKDDDGTRPFFLQPSEMNNCYPGTRSNASWVQTGSTNRNQYYCGEINRPNDYVTLNDGPVVEEILVDGIPATLAGQDVYNDGQGLVYSGVMRDLKYTNLIADWDIFGSEYTLTIDGAYRDEERMSGSDSDHSSVNLIRANSAAPPPTTVPPPLIQRNAQGSGIEINEIEDYSAEIRIESPGSDRLRWLAGLYYYKQDFDIANTNINFTNPRGTGLQIFEETENKAVFASVSYDITDAIEVTLEGRYFDEEKSRLEIDNYATSDVDTLPDFDETADFSEFAPRLTVNYQITDDVMLYGIYAKGYKPGGVNGSSGAQVGSPEYDQEESDNFEVGAKTAWFDARLIANVAVFFNDLTDYQLTTALSNASLFGALTSIVTNQGDGEVFGAEVELTYDLTDDIQIGATYALADTEFTKGCDDFQWILTSGGGNIFSGAGQDGNPCLGNNVNGQGNGSIEGNAFPLSAKNMASAFTNFRRSLGGEVELFGGADISWEDKKPVQVHNLAWVPDNTIVNARIGVDVRNLSVSLYGRNLTDEDAPNMVTRWLQYPLASVGAGGTGGTVTPSIVASTDPDATNSCAAGVGGCSTNFPRAFFGDFRRGRNFGIEFNYRFGGGE